MQGRSFRLYNNTLLISAAILVAGIATLIQSKGAGPIGAKDYGSFENIAIVLIIMIVTLLINHYGKGMLSNCSILIGMIAGYILCIFLGKIDFSTIESVSWFAFPNIFAYGVTFKLSAVLAFIPAYIVSIISTVGCLKAVEEVSEVPN